MTAHGEQTWTDVGFVLRASGYPCSKCSNGLNATMTEYELADIISSYAVQGGTFFAIWLTIVSAYALVAYVAGKDLTAFQVVWLNVLYLFAALLTIFAFWGSFNSHIFYVEAIRELHPESPQVMNYRAAVMATASTIAGTFSTLLFMWQVRRAKTG